MVLGLVLKRQTPVQKKLLVMLRMLRMLRKLGKPKQSLQKKKLYVSTAYTQCRIILIVSYRQELKQETFKMQRNNKVERPKPERSKLVKQRQT